MSGRFNSIDLGPLSLSFFQQSELNDVKLDDASRSDIEKLHEFLHNGNNNNNLEQTEECKKLSDVDSNKFITSLSDSEKIFELISISSQAVFSIFNQPDKSKIDCAELKIRDNILPDSTIKAFKKNNKYYFDLCIGDENNRKLIVKKLPDLVIQIGERINHALVINIFNCENKTLPIATCDWPKAEYL